METRVRRVSFLRPLKSQRLKRPHLNVSDFSGARQAQRVDDHGSNVICLHQILGSVGSILHLMHAFLKRGRRASKIDTQYAYPVLIDFLAETVGNSLERMFCRSILAQVLWGRESDAGVDENNLSTIRTQHWK